MSTSSSWQRIGQGPCTPKAPPKLSCNAERHQSGARARASLLSLGLPHVVWQRGPAALAPVGSAALLGAVWLSGRAGELLLKTQPAREVVGACGGISLCSGGMLGDVVVPLAVTLGWEPWLWE